MTYRPTMAGPVALINCHIIVILQYFKVFWHVTLIKINYYNYCTALWLLGAEMWKQMQLRKYGRKI